MDKFGCISIHSFYPFLDWSTYFLTDTIGAFFWLLQIFLIDKYIQKPSINIISGYALILIISLFNREQSVLMFVVTMLSLICCRVYNINGGVVSSLKKIFKVSLGISIAYYLFNAILKQPSIYDSWIYLQSNFGYFHENYTFNETAQFLVSALVKLHIGLVHDVLQHRWWLTFSILGFIGLFRVFLVSKKPAILDILVLASSISSYIGLIIVPFLSHRYFYPTIIGIIYFSMIELKQYFEKADRIRLR